MIETPNNTDILDRLDSGLNNVEGSTSPVELGGVLLTMKEAAVEIRKIRAENKKLRKELDGFKFHKPSVGYSKRK